MISPNANFQTIGCSILIMIVEPLTSSSSNHSRASSNHLNSIGSPESQTVSFLSALMLMTFGVSFRQVMMRTDCACELCADKDLYQIPASLNPPHVLD